MRFLVSLDSARVLAGKGAFYVGTDVKPVVRVDLHGDMSRFGKLVIPLSRESLPFYVGTDVKPVVRVDLHGDMSRFGKLVITLSRESLPFSVGPGVTPVFRLD